MAALTASGERNMAASRLSGEGVMRKRILVDPRIRTSVGWDEGENQNAGGGGGCLNSEDRAARPDWRGCDHAFVEEQRTLDLWFEREGPDQTLQ